MAKSPRCEETTHCSNGPLCLKELHIIVYVLLQKYGILTSTFKEMRNLKYYKNNRRIYTFLSHVRLCLSLSILPFESMKVGDHLICTLGTNCALYSGK